LVGCYNGQLFNAVALYVSSVLAAPSKLGWLYTLNALLVVLLQLPVTNLAQHWSNGRQLHIVQFSYATFTLSFIMPLIIPGYMGAVVLVLLFTLAEMMFVPSVDVLLLSLIGKENRAVGYSVLSVSTAVGELVGGGMGVAIYRWMADHGYPNGFWLAIAGLSLIFIVVTRALQTPSYGLRSHATVVHGSTCGAEKQSGIGECPS
jgi:MFS family permease